MGSYVYVQLATHTDQGIAHFSELVERTTCSTMAVRAYRDLLGIVDAVCRADTDMGGRRYHMKEVVHDGAPNATVFAITNGYMKPHNYMRLARYLAQCDGWDGEYGTFEGGAIAAFAMDMGWPADAARLICCITIS